MKLLFIIGYVFTFATTAFAFEEVCTPYNVDASIDAVRSCLPNVPCAVEFARNNPITRCIAYQARCTQIVSSYGDTVFEPTPHGGHAIASSIVIQSVCKPYVEPKPNPAPAPSPVPQPVPSPKPPVTPLPPPSCASLRVLECARTPRCELIGGSGGGIGPHGYRCCLKGAGFNSCGPNIYN